MKKTIYTILVMAAPAMAQLTLNPLPSREFGQATLLNPSPNSASPNLVVGQELYNPSAIAFDTSVAGPPRVYVADTGNNRVLGWSNANAVGQTLGKASMADMVLGQEPAAAGGFDFTATLWWGPQTNNNIGLDTPTGVAVDAAGNVYVADSCNNRILRFATPYKQQPGNLIVDLVIGQKSYTSGSSPNQNQSAPSSTSLALAVGSCPGNVLPAGLAIDNQGNLWAADPGNQRVLMFPAANLTANNQLPQATVVLGQFGFTSFETPSNKQTDGGFLVNPTSVATDTKGNVYVTDQGGRALVYTAPIQPMGQTASTILGIPPTPTQGLPVQPYPNQSSLGSVSGNSLTGSPQGVFVLNNGPNGVSVLVCDSPQNRVVVYNSLVVPANANSPLISTTVGQNGSFTLGQANQGMTAPTNMTFWNPVAGAIRPDNNEMWIVDQSNHRVVAFTSQGGGVYSSASRVLGQTDYIYNGANLLEGRELWLASPQFSGAGIAFDTSSCTLGLNPPASCTAPPYLYIADTLNNRVLGFKNGLSVGINSMNQLAQTADIVIGQADRFHNLANYSPGNTTTSTLVQPTATGLFHPVGLAVDKNGNLWVADSGNGRVVRFPKPFAQPANQPQTADTVLGQNSLTSYNPSASQFLMDQPYGLTLFSNGNLAVSDPAANRVLVFNANGGLFTSGQAAAIVIGQSGFNSTTSGSGNTQLNSPRHLAVDSSDFLYICDYNNGRLVVYSKPVSNPPGNPAFVSGFIGQPEAIAVSYATGYIWIASGALVTQFPALNQLSQNPTPNQQFQQFTLANAAAFGPLAVALDPFDNVVVADSANRLSFFYGQLSYRNTASYAAGVGSGAGPSPTMLVIITRETFPALNQGFLFTPSYTGTDVNNAPPWPTTDPANGIQVTVNGKPAPIFRIEPYGVFVEIPNQAPSSGPAEFLVSNPSTGQILGAAILNMQQASPGLYTVNSEGTGPVAANNYDVSGNPLPLPQFINSAANPVSAGGIIGLWLTGAGNIPGLPADGTAPNGLFQTPVYPNVYINGVTASVVGSAMSPQYPGLWQVNVIVPVKTPPSSSIGPASVVVQMDTYNSNIGGNTQNLSTGAPGQDIQIPINSSLITSIYVK